MINDRLNQLIKDAILNRDNKLRLEVLRSIKTSFMNWETAKNAKPLDEQVIIRKMIKDRENAADMYIKGNRPDLANKELAEVDILKEFVAAEASEDETRTAITKVIRELDSDSVNVGNVMKGIKSALPNANMALVNKLVKQLLNQ